ncbi:MAG: hypothetical protein A3F17_08655 [Gammaproteobacteria bacterium RIFCSPHIGHO2_12_FULL_41_15]|nr:MAG: hypothetical protein A3F17_08655 [Gammaproteobacteria bacterium RIFCSPHIGHO2_12_FULL_41_15]
MSKQMTYWESIIAEYKVSGLSQPAFCKQNSLSCNQFQYRWYQHNLAKRTKKNPFTFENNCMANSFESVTIAHPASRDETNHVVELALHLPNKIRCDFKMDIRNDAFATLLKQLVVLC